MINKDVIQERKKSRFLIIWKKHTGPYDPKKLMLE